MTRLQQVQEALAAAQAALVAVHEESAGVNAQEEALRRRYPASGDALDRATISLALQQEIPALSRRIEARRASAERDIEAAQAAVDAVLGEIAETKTAIVRRSQRTETGGYFDVEIDRIRADADARIMALEAARRDELNDLPGMYRRLEGLGGALTA